MSLKTTINVNSVITCAIGFLISFFIYTSHEWVNSVRADVTEVQKAQRQVEPRLTKIETESSDRWEEVKHWMKSVSEKLDEISKGR